MCLLGRQRQTSTRYGVLNRIEQRTAYQTYRCVTDDMSGADVPASDTEDADERRREMVVLLERLTAQAKLSLVREGNRIRAPAMEASAEGVLISEVLGIFLFLFLLLGMVVFFHKETDCAAQFRRRVGGAASALKHALRRRLCRFHRQWSCQQDDLISPSPEPGVYRGLSEEQAAAPDTTDTTTNSGDSGDAPFNHREALLEVFADLGLHREVVRDSLRGYTEALSRLSAGRAAPPSLGPGNVAPLKGILRAPAPARGHGRHRHHHRHRHGGGTAAHASGAARDRDVIPEESGDVTGEGDPVASEPSHDRILELNGDGAFEIGDNVGYQDEMVPAPEQGTDMTHDLDDGVTHGPNGDVTCKQDDDVTFDPKNDYIVEFGSGTDSGLDGRSNFKSK
ncbi:uncharacterized protein LOC119109926 [Pollicipes pollicipes]|uniref:uncharacterized protein LOC119109926 n=1 Tax=Pollicipes pollicipes TaxID=41117 RepID=UPI001884EDF7|nr:uncharacterized protein LOC119109926 [Pollicipes pollicipes]